MVEWEQHGKKSGVFFHEENICKFENEGQKVNNKLKIIAVDVDLFGIFVVAQALST